jgi:hypothetical protein
MNGMLEDFVGKLLQSFKYYGHNVQEKPDNQTDLILTTAPYGVSLSWRKAVIFNARRLYNLNRLPTILTILHVTPADFQNQLEKLSEAAHKDHPDPEYYRYPGLAPAAHNVLHGQARRGGPILALERIVQAQSKSLRILLLVSDDDTKKVYHFDLVGAHPVSDSADEEIFFHDIIHRVVTTLSTHEVRDHTIVNDPVPQEQWQQLSTPSAMAFAAKQFGNRNFFTDMIRIADIVQVPAVEASVSSQYSEGCFATWDPQLDALISTVTGSEKPVDKGNITDEDLAVLVGVRSDKQGALVRHVEGKQNHAPSTEAVELMGMDLYIPKINLPSNWGITGKVPAIRSKLHGHRGVSHFDPGIVEHVPLEPAFYDYPVTCGTEAQADGIIQAFSRSEALQNIDDPRQIVFTVLPGHGTVIAEKWIHGKQPFQILWESMDSGAIQIDNLVPQGRIHYTPGEAGMMRLDPSKT